VPRFGCEGPTSEQARPREQLQLVTGPIAVAGATGGCQPQLPGGPVHRTARADTTTNTGHGIAMAPVRWEFSPERRAKSVIVHVEHTNTEPGEASMAGARLGCLTVSFTCS
jgi:hypothetical protein